MGSNTIKIMAVDDNPDNLITLRALLSEMFPDALVFFANNGQQALDMISIDEPDVILLDIIMPGMDGFEVCSRLKEDSALSDIPIIFLTALNEDKKIRIKALDVGAEAFLSKPIDILELTAQIRAMLKIRSANLLKKSEKNRLEEMVANGTIELENELKERKHAEEVIKHLNETLEQKVRQRTLELEQSNQALEAFSLSVSHDLRAPLRVINGLLQILVKEYLDNLGSEAKHMVQVVVDKINRMDEIINGLLSISKISSLDIKKSTIEMTEMVESIYQESASPLDKKRITINIQKLLTGFGDSVLIRQVWVNLIENAVKFSQKKETPIIQISSYQENNQTIYQIKDNGAGFNSAYQNKLYTIFQRLHSEDEYQGTGVGLALVHQIIQKHGGKVWAEGVEGQGATFYFSLPIQPEEKQ